MPLPSGRALAVMAALQQLPASAAAGTLALPSFWGSSMVLPRGTPLVLWGTDTPGANVTVTYAGGTWHASQPAGADGRFQVALPASNATTAPQNVVVASTSGDTITLSDVVVGDVYVCSGQSNMELPVSCTAEYAALERAADSLGATLRIFQVSREDTYSDVKTPQDNLTASIPWSRASSDSIGGMSAFCYCACMREGMNVCVHFSAMRRAYGASSTRCGCHVRVVSLRLMRAPAPHPPTKPTPPAPPAPGSQPCIIARSPPAPQRLAQMPQLPTRTSRSACRTHRGAAWRSR